MANKTRLVPYHAPGLPTWPRLRFDRERKYAQVIVRVPTWRSWGRAYFATRVVRWLINFYVGWQVWHQLAFLDYPFGQGFWVMIVVAMFTAAAKPWLHAALDGFFARHPFAVTTKFWFAPNAIAVKSRLYTNGIIIRRDWNGRKVDVTFDVDSDQDAQDHLLPRKDGTFQESRKNTASQLRLIIAADNHERMAVLGDDPSMMRAIHVIDLDQDDAAAVATVLIAASALTQPSPSRRPTIPTGIDIDTNGL